MNRNNKALIKACKNKNIEFQINHKSKNLISLFINKKIYLFLNWATPLNSQSITKLCQDKDFFYSIYHDVINMPQTTSYLNPYSNEKYTQYLNETTIYETVNNILETHNYPLIIKKNSGSWGTNIFKVNNFQKLEKSILTVFNMNSASFDYICLAQDYIDIKQEFRVIFLNGEYQFSYEKIVSKNIKHDDEQSPFSYEDSKAQLIQDEKIISNIKDFCAPLFLKLMIPFCGLDIALDKNGKYWLIEANSAPGFDNLIKHENEDIVISLYEKIIDELK